MILYRHIPSSSKFSRNVYNNFQLRNKELIKLWQACTSVEDLYRRYDKLKEGHLDSLRQDSKYMAALTENFEHRLRSAKAVLYDHGQANCAHGPNEVARARAFVRDFGHSTALDHYFSSMNCFSTVENTRERVRRLKKKGVASLRALTRAVPSPASTTDFSKLDAYARSLL